MSFSVFRKRSSSFLDAVAMGTSSVAVIHHEQRRTRFITGYQSRLRLANPISPEPFIIRPRAAVCSMRICGEKTSVWTSIQTHRSVGWRLLREAVGGAPAMT